MILPNISEFIKNYVTKREISFFENDLVNNKEKLTTEIETGQAPFDQQQKLTMEFYEKRINQLEEAIEKIKDSQLELKNGH